jgi:hypothetical protein
VVEAERDLRTAIRLNPNYADAHHLLGRLLDVDGRLDESLVEMRLATELDPLSSRIFDNYSSQLRQAGRFTDALAMAERALALQPDSLQALRTKWEALSELGRLEEALTIARSAVFRDLQHRVVALLVRAGRKDEAAKLYSTLSLRRRLTTTPLAALGRYEEARSGHAHTAAYLGWCEHRLGPGCALSVLQLERVEESPLLAWLGRARPDVLVFVHLYDMLAELRAVLRRNRERVPSGLGVAVLSQIVEGSGFSGLQQNQPLMGAWAVELLAARITNRDLGIPANPRIEMVEGEWVEGGTLAGRKT